MSLEALLRRDRWLSLAALAVVLALAWGWLLAGAGMHLPLAGPADAGAMPGMDGMKDMDEMAGMHGMAAPAWGWRYALLMFAMWWSMMLAMMLPSAAPVILLVAALNRRMRPQRPPYGAAAGFAAGYLLAWGAFSLLATAAQWWLGSLQLLDPLLRSQQAVLSGGLLLVAGAWQLAPLKSACLRHCRSPLELLTRQRRRGSLWLGMAHGSYCLGCCWLLMALLFVGGLMNLYWIVGLSLWVLVEKLLPAGPWLGRLGGVALLLWGATLLAG
ncbi:DUF2182 domain-containing protein [Pseudomonas oryzae]|uniref:Predicted metal-binding membrane protein n=1 Tax=Pseudomonas oryzae TaxID=1392877 RepID=A0A1H1W3F1_9PSED|nr:DUF2182 domain-containing protein [Pseudomonas oryzae]SDS91575.1 Predicted metal-binding membrane protein [Pseudomonas oryzae]